ncbi:MAG: hypothetical protein J7L38_05725 [Thermoproteales archaeon]|nr:hypothetical protein [Thermoproteales archaeon]
MDFIKKTLEDRFEEWKSVKGMLYGRTKAASFDELFVYMKPIGIFEYKYIFSAMINLVPTNLMNEKYAEVYRRLKSFECDLNVKGIFRKQYSFIPRKDLNDLAKLIEGFQPSDLLAQNLNRDENVMECIRRLGAVEFNIRLKSVSELYAPFIANKEAMLQAEKAFYENPEDVVWVLSLTTLLSHSPGLKKKIRNIYNALETISAKIREISSEITENIEKE